MKKIKCIINEDYRLHINQSCIELSPTADKYVRSLGRGTYSICGTKHIRQTSTVRIYEIENTYIIYTDGTKIFTLCKELVERYFGFIPKGLEIARISASTIDYRIKRTFESMIHDIEEINPEAAKYVRTHATGKEDTLAKAFVFAHTPQGHNFWMNIHREIENNRKDIP